MDQHRLFTPLKQNLKILSEICGNEKNFASWTEFGADGVVLARSGNTRTVQFFGILRTSYERLKKSSTSSFVATLSFK